jgi:hypothetical protein
VRLWWIASDNAIYLECIALSACVASKNKKGGPLPSRPGTNAPGVLGRTNAILVSYCLSYTCTSCAFAPLAEVPVRSTVVTFPSFETATLDVPTTLPPFFCVAT